MTDQGRRANDDDGNWQNPLQGTDPHRPSWSEMNTWPDFDSSNTNVNLHLANVQYRFIGMDAQAGVPYTSAGSIDGSGETTVSAPTYAPEPISHNTFAGHPTQLIWPVAAPGPESEPLYGPPSYFPQQVHGLGHNNGPSGDHGDASSTYQFEQATTNGTFNSFVDVQGEAIASSDFMSHSNVEPFVPYQQQFNTTFAFDTRHGGHHHAAVQQHHLLAPGRHTQQAALTQPTQPSTDTDTTSSSWVMLSPPSDFHRQISEGRESVPYELGGLALDSSPSNNVSSPSQPAEDTSLTSPTIKAEPPAEPELLTGDVRYQHNGGRSVKCLRERAPKCKVSKRSGKLTEAARANAADMRKGKRCLRCKIYKLGCDGNNPCQRCQKVCNTARQFREPCTRSDIKDASLVRQSNGRFNQDPVEFKSYHFLNVEGTAPTFHVQWYLPGKIRIAEATLSVSYREYVPEQREGLDTTTYFINASDRVRTIETSAFAACDPPQLLRDVDNLLSHAQPQVEQWIIRRYKQQDNKLYLLTFLEALRYRDDYGSATVGLAIEMQCGAIMSQGFGSVLGGESRKFQLINYSEPCEYDAYNREQDTPVPQAIGHQFDVAILKHLDKVQKKLLKELERKMFQSGMKPWYEIFLACFIIMSNLEWIHDQARAYIESKKRTMLETQVSHVVRTQLLRWQFSVKIMIQHFRVILNGLVPFQLARDKLAEVKERAKLDNEASQYIQQALMLLDDQSSMYALPTTVPVKDDVPVAGRWVRQLFKQSYRPG